MKKFNLTLIAALLFLGVQSQTVSTFENLSLPPDTFYNGADLAGGFLSGNAYFVNDYDTTYQSWSGFSYSTKTDSLTAGYNNQYSAITGSGYNSSTYAVADEYGNAKIRLNGNASGKLVKGFYVTNATYAYLSMRDGDMFAKKFGGTSGNDPDWFKLTAKGWLNGILKNDTVEFYLADFRFTDNSEDYLVKNWEWVSLLPLGNVDSIQFFLSSSDMGSFGMNTPAYFCLDNFTTADKLNVAPVSLTDYVTVNYATDTLIDVLLNDVDSTATPLSVTLVSTPLIPGASATINNNQVLYVPAIGIVSTDTLTYQVCDAANACTSGQLVINVVALNGIVATNYINLSVYPNPFQSQFSISGLEGEYRATITNLNGQVVFDGTQKGNTTVYAENWDCGIYTLVLVQNEQTHSIKLVR